MAPALNRMQTCNSHPHCKPAGGFYPTRLINMTDLDNPRVELRDEITAGTRCRYATLSYVWGRVHPYVLEVANLEGLRKGLDITKLSKTVLDAMRVAAQLGMSCIWIDALCIVQNSPEDMSEELHRPPLRSVYWSTAIRYTNADTTARHLPSLIKAAVGWARIIKLAANKWD